MFARIGLNRNLQILVLTIFTNLLARYTWYALLPLHLRALGANEWEIGLAFTATTLAHNVFSFLGGALADRYGRRLLIALSTIAMGPFYIFAGLSPTWFAVAASLVAAEICGAFQWPPMSALIVESSETDRVAHSFSFTESAVMLGLILGPMLGAGLLLVVNLQTLMMATGVMLILNGILRGAILSEPARHNVGNALPHLRAAINANVRWYIVAAAFVVTSFAIVFGPFFAILARDVWRNSHEEINLLWSAGSFASLCGIALGRLSDRWGGKRVMMIGAFGFGVGAIAWGVAPTWEWGLAPLLITFAFSEMIFIAQQTIQADITTAETRSSVIGVISTATGLIGGLGPTLGAWLITLGGNPMPFIAVGIMGLTIIAAIAPVRMRASSASTF